MTEPATFSLDGRTVPFVEGESVIDAAAAAGVYIPRLCHRPGFAPHGSCKLCTVIVDGRAMAACTTPARAGMVVENDTPALNEDRRALVELLFVEGNHICPACEKTGACDLQAVGYHLGVTALRFDHFFPPRDLDASHPDVLLDRNRCILCALCVRASSDVDRKNVFAIAGRGINSKLVVNAASGRLGDTDLAIDDTAVRACPVGAILVKREAYTVPIGSRRYDRHPIAEVAVRESPRRAPGDGDD
jgi:[NiFe] hydrogenase diaphorase moiety small subunit